MAGYVDDDYILHPEEIATIDDPYGTGPAVVKAVHDAVGDGRNYYALFRTYGEHTSRDVTGWFHSDDEALDHFRKYVGNYWRAQLFLYLAGVRTEYDFDEIMDALYGTIY